MYRQTDRCTLYKLYSFIYKNIHDTINECDFERFIVLAEKNNNMQSELCNTGSKPTYVCRIQ